MRSKVGASLAAVVVLVSGADAAFGGEQGKPSSARIIVIPEGTERAYDEVHYAPAVRVGDMVIVSGVPAGGPGDYDAQVRRMFERIKTTLAVAGASMEDVVELISFHRAGPGTEAFRAEFEKFNAIHHEYFPRMYPAWTATANATLLSPTAVAETRVLAVIGSGRGATIRRAGAAK